MGQSLPARVTQTGQKRQWEPRRNSTHPSTISSRTKDIIKCAWKARESNFAWEIWILWWNPGLVISFSLHLSKEAETGTNNSYRIYLFGNICERVSQHWVHFTGIIKPDRILWKFRRFDWEKNLPQIKQGLCEGGKDCTGTGSLRSLLQPHCSASVKAAPRQTSWINHPSVQTEGRECILGYFLKAEVGDCWLRTQAGLANPSWTEWL